MLFWGTVYFFAKPDFIYLYSSRNETFPINTNELVLEAGSGLVFWLWFNFFSLLLFIELPFTDGYHGEFSMVQYRESFWLITPFKRFLLAISLMQLKFIVKFIGGIILVEMLEACPKFPLFLVWFIALMFRCTKRSSSSWIWFFEAAS